MADWDDALKREVTSAYKDVLDDIALIRQELSTVSLDLETIITNMQRYEDAVRERIVLVNAQ